MELLVAAGIVISITILGAASPGPDTALIFKNSFIASRKVAFATALGIVTGNTIYVFVALLGLGVALTNSGSTYVFIQVLGAAYLMYLGAKLLMSHGEGVKNDAARHETQLTVRAAFVEGFVTNILNPKFVLFLLAMFSQVIGPEWSVGTKVFLGLLIPLSAFCVFSALILLLTHERLRASVESVRTHVERVMGVVLVTLGLKVIISVSNYI